MQDNERRNYAMLVRSRDFFATRATIFPATSRGGELFATLETVLGEIESNAEAKVLHASAAAQGTASRGATRDILCATLKAWSRTARAIAADIPGFDKLFRLPRGINDQTLLSTARAFLTNAEPHKAEFVRNEFAPTFHEDLRALVNEFEQSISNQNQSLGARVSATRAVKTAIARGVALVRQLDAIVRNKFSADPAALAEWDSATHVERAPRRAKPKPNSGNGATHSD